MSALRLLSPYAIAAYVEGARALYWPPINDDAPIPLDTPVIGDDWEQTTIEEWLDAHGGRYRARWREQVLRELAANGLSAGGAIGDPESWYVSIAPERNNE